MSRKRYSDAVKTKAVKLYKKGASLARICRRREMPNDVSTVRQWLVDRSIKIRTNAHVYPRKKILREMKNGASRQDLQKRYGCSAKYLSNLATGKLEP